jgi:hypothetical protein
MPWYVCDSLLEAVHMSGIAMGRYSVDDDLCVDPSIHLAADDWLLYVNYFGLHDRRVDEVLARFPPAQVVIDNAQAFYSPPREGAAAIYSPRKFFGVPDGGFLFAAVPIQPPIQAESDTLLRVEHLIRRLQAEPEDGYDAFLAAERSFSQQEPVRISTLAWRLLESIDYAGAGDRRRRNFLALHAALQASNSLDLVLEEAAVPLCYPLRTGDSELRKRLIEARVFVPTYWREVADGSDAPRSQRNLAVSILPIPCDQRYTSEDMAAILAVINR